MSHYKPILGFSVVRTPSKQTTSSKQSAACSKAEKGRRTYSGALMHIRSPHHSTTDGRWPMMIGRSPTANNRQQLTLHRQPRGRFRTAHAQRELLRCLSREHP